MTQPKTLRGVMMMTFDIHAEWDAEAGVWIATSEEVLGLCVQAETFDELVEVVAALVPELLMENHIATPDLIPIRVLAERTATVRAAA
jgi:predicted RNase H-like HicB family nuclease